MSKKILYFEGAGTENTGTKDVNNCRIRTAFINDSNEKIYLEILCGYMNGNKDCIYIDCCHYITDDEKGYFTISNFERANIGSYSYTKKNIIALVNKHCNCSFEDMIVLPWLSGYNVHGDNRAYNLMDDFIYDELVTEKKRYIYKVAAADRFNSIYEKNVTQKTRHLYTPNRNTWSLLESDNEKLVLRSHTYKELISDDDRIQVFYLSDF